RDMPRMWIVTKGGQAIESDREIDPSQTTIWGMARSLAQEHSEFQPSLIDLSLDGSGDEITEMLAQMQSDDREDQILLRAGKRYVGRLAHQQVNNREKLELKAAATYLISGGIGALGLTVAQWMADRGAKHIVLL